MHTILKNGFPRNVCVGGGGYHAQFQGHVACVSRGNAVWVVDHMFHQLGWDSVTHVLVHHNFRIWALVKGGEALDASWAASQASTSPPPAPLLAHLTHVWRPVEF